VEAFVLDLEEKQVKQLQYFIMLTLLDFSCRFGDTSHFPFILYPVRKASVSEAKDLLSRSGSA
jgi:hypothetical protein